MLEQRVRDAIRDVADFPAPGILFRDITPLLADSALLTDVIGAMVSPFSTPGMVTHVVGIESRGFLFGVPIAMALGAAFVPMRKPGRLPQDTLEESYALEYRSDVLQMHRDAFERPPNASAERTSSRESPGKHADTARVLIVDDVLATGGTIAAAERLVAKGGGVVAGVSVLIELSGLAGRSNVGCGVFRAVVSY